MNQEIIGGLLSSAMNQYVFQKIFQEHNNGKSFDMDKWISEASSIVSDPMFAISEDKQKKLGELLENLDDFAMLNDNKNDVSKPKLVLN